MTQEKQKHFTLVKENIFITGTSDEIVTKLKKLSWDDLESNFKYMLRVQRRIKQLHGKDITVESSEGFLEALHEADEVILFEESPKKNK